MRLLVVSLFVCNFIAIRALPVGEGYSGDTPVVAVQFLNDPKDVHEVELRLDYADYFFLGPAFQNYTIHHEKTYDPKTYNGKYDSDLNITSPQRYKAIQLIGKKYKGFLKSALFDGENEALLPVVEETPETKVLTLLSEGVLGLDFTEKIENNAILQKILAKNKKLLVRRGPFEQQLHDKKLKDPKGTHIANNDQLEGCGALNTAVDTVSKKGWTVKGSLTINGTDTKIEEFTFSFDGQTYLPKEVYDQFYANIQTEEAIPSFSVKIGDKDYSVNEDNFKYYSSDDTYREEVKVFVKSHDKKHAVLGKSFLRDYCIQISAVDLTKPKIALAIRENLDNDVKFVEDVAPLRPTDAPLTTTPKSAVTAFINVLCLLAALLLTL